MRASWNQHFLNEFPDLQARAEIFPINANEAADPVLTVTLDPTDERPYVHEGIVNSLPAGSIGSSCSVEHADLKRNRFQPS
ncbi:MAG: hypothetical protein R3B91_14450 [Planctomycetaceae bacterium]